MHNCNYCIFKEITKNAKKAKEEVMVIPSSFMSGVNIFVLPTKMFTKNQVRAWSGPSARLPNGEPLYHKYKRVWFGSLPISCCC